MQKISYVKLLKVSLILQCKSDTTGQMLYNLAELTLS